MVKSHFTRIGFILASAGSAVGLGNIWKFPYLAGEHGGGAFVMVFLFTILFIGLPILIAEIALGNIAQKEPVSAYEHLAPNRKKYWRFAGLSILASFFILTFYSVVVGWILYYIYIVLFTLPESAQEAERVFMGMLTEGIEIQLFFHTLSMILLGFIVSKGVKKGIEKLNFILMPALLLIVVGMLFYAMSLDAFGKAFEFIFYPDLSKLTPYSILVSVGQAFFTLSIGMGAIMTYAAVSKTQTNIVRSSLWIILIDTFIALAAGLMMFTFLFDSGATPNQGPGLVFISMPAVFYQMGFIGNLFALLFFIALAFAAITSAVSILEPTIAHLTQRHKVSRFKAVFVSSLIIYLIGIIALLSNIKGFESLTLFGKSAFDFLDFFTSALMLPLGGLSLAIFMGYVVDKHIIERHLLESHLQPWHIKAWLFSVRYTIPIALVLVMLNSLGVIDAELFKQLFG